MMNNIFEPFQYGFRTLYSPEPAVTRVVNYFLLTMNSEAAYKIMLASMVLLLTGLFSVKIQNQSTAA